VYENLSVISYLLLQITNEYSSVSAVSFFFRLLFAGTIGTAMIIASGVS